MIGVLGALAALGLLALGTDEFGRGVAFVLTVDLDADGHDEVVVGLEAGGTDNIAEFIIPGDVYVFSHRRATQPTGILYQVFSCREAVPVELLPGFFQATVARVGDLDGDGQPEVVLVWLEEYWWPTAYRPLAVLQSTGSRYEMIIDTKRSVSEIGDYAVVDLDDDGRMEILEIKAIWGKVIHEDGTEEWECHWCPHRYSVQVFTFTGSAFIPDERFNGGEPMITEGKYLPGLADTAVGSFLPDLIALARSHLK